MQKHNSHLQCSLLCRSAGQQVSGVHGTMHIAFVPKTVPWEVSELCRSFCTLVHTVSSSCSANAGSVGICNNPSLSRQVRDVKLVSVFVLPVLANVDAVCFEHAGMITCTLSCTWLAALVMTASTGAVPCTQDSCSSGDSGMLATPSSVSCWNLHRLNHELLSALSDIPRLDNTCPAFWLTWLHETL